MKTVDLIIPVYNEEEVINLFHNKLTAALINLPYIFTIWYINDGSKDGTGSKLAEIAGNDPRVQVVELSRNFGHQAALTAGLDRAQADYVISLDGDGQHPPELICELLKLAESGYDIVQTERLDAEDISAFKRWTSAAFYRLINRIGSTQITPGAADFRLLSHQVVEALRNMPEYHRFLRGMVAWVGYKSIILPYNPPPRMAGKSKYSLQKMVRLSMDAVFSFSLVPLYIGISLGILMLLLALIEMIYVLSFWVTGNISHLAPGWSSLMFIILIVGGFLMISIGVIGVYIGYIFQEVKGRPVYLVREPESVMENGKASDR
ncbi:MAG: glycosyltransferase family 2 protein [Chloroflexi bacterium]|nr:glycosyltransferase family 2 protein [Chloroflexota bacterium]